LNPFAISFIVFASVFGGAVIGMSIRGKLPDHHLASDSRDVVKLGMGLIGTMAALVLGLLVASAKGSYDTQRAELTQLSANVILLDRILVHYGPEAADARSSLRDAALSALYQLWPEDSPQVRNQSDLTAKGNAFYDKIQELTPQTEPQRSIQSQAESMSISLGQTRWLLFEQSGSSISMPLLIVLIFWLTVIFASYGILAPPNSTVVATLFLCAVAVAGAIFLILEMDRPFEGMIRISSAPLRNAIAQLGGH
jgi:hypothetical protein